VGISGLFTMAWTTSALVGVVSSHRQLLGQIEDEREDEMKMRFALGKEEWDALRKEKAEERSEREKARTQAYGASFVQQRKILEDERKKNEELRSAMRAEIEELRRKERQEEEKLGSGTPPVDSQNKEPQ
jgi:hypothetical protein